MNSLKHWISKKLNQWTGATKRINALENCRNWQMTVIDQLRFTKQSLEAIAAHQLQTIKDLKAQAIEGATTRDQIAQKQQDLDDRARVVCEMESMLDEWSGLWSALETELAEKKRQLHFLGDTNNVLSRRVVAAEQKSSRCIQEVALFEATLSQHGLKVNRNW